MGGYGWGKSKEEDFIIAVQSALDNGINFDVPKTILLPWDLRAHCRLPKLLWRDGSSPRPLAIQRRRRRGLKSLQFLLW